MGLPYVTGSQLKTAIEKVKAELKSGEQSSSQTGSGLSPDDVIAIVDRAISDEELIVDRHPSLPKIRSGDSGKLLVAGDEESDTDFVLQSFPIDFFITREDFGVNAEVDGSEKLLTSIDYDGKSETA